MANGMKVKGRRLGWFVLSGRYKEVGPEIGRFYEAYNVLTGRPVLALRPGRRMQWLLEEGWRLIVSSHRKPSLVVLEVERAPPSGRGTKVVDFFVLLCAALQRVEDNRRMDTHLTREPMKDRTRAVGSPGRPRAGWALATVGGLLALGVSFWLGGVREAYLRDSAARRVAASRADDVGTAPVAYPLPKKPFSSQRAAPCDPKLDQIEINGGCWAELARRAPCLAEVQAEYQGKCYIPIGKKEEPPLQSLQP